MKTISTIVAGCAAALAIASPGAAKDKPGGEERLAKILDGRVAGEPQSCIHLPSSANLTVIDKTAIVYKRGNTYYVNRPANPERLRSYDVLVIDRLAHQLCSTDMVHTRSQGSMSFRNGSVFLGQFVPYRKVDAAG